MQRLGDENATLAELNDIWKFVDETLELLWIRTGARALMEREERNSGSSSSLTGAPREWRAKSKLECDVWGLAVQAGIAGVARMSKLFIIVIEIDSPVSRMLDTRNLQASRNMTCYLKKNCK